MGCENLARHVNSEMEQGLRPTIGIVHFNPKNREIFIPLAKRGEWKMGKGNILSMLVANGDAYIDKAVVVEHVTCQGRRLAAEVRLLREPELPNILPAGEESPFSNRLRIGSVVEHGQRARIIDIHYKNGCPELLIKPTWFLQIASDGRRTPEHDRRYDTISNVLSTYWVKVSTRKNIRIRTQFVVNAQYARHLRHSKFPTLLWLSAEGELSERSDPILGAKIELGSPSQEQAFKMMELGLFE